MKSTSLLPDRLADLIFLSPSEPENWFKSLLLQNQLLPQSQGFPRCLLYKKPKTDCYQSLHTHITHTHAHILHTHAHTHTQLTREWWHLPLISALRRQQQMGVCGFEASLICIMSFKSARATTARSHLRPPPIGKKKFNEEFT